MLLCKSCGEKVNARDAALTKKLINRGAEEFLCAECLALKFKLDKAELIRMAEQFKKAGCMLFR